MRQESLAVEPRMVIATTDFAIATYGALFLLNWRLNTTAQACDLARIEVELLAATFPRGIAVLTIVDEAAPMPSQEARQALSTLMQDAGSSTRAAAIVFEGTGFRASAVRSVVTGLTMMARQPYPQHVFAKVQEAIAWLCQQTNGQIEPKLTVFHTARAVAMFRDGITRECETSILKVRRDA